MGEKNEMALEQEPVEQKVYHANPGYRLTDEDAATVGPVLESLANEGRATPDDIVQVARDEASPLHRFFDWDDSSAATQHRLWQARHLARSYRVEIVTFTNNRPITVLAPGLVSIKETSQRRSYRTIETVRDNTAYIAQMAQEAERRLRYWRNEYVMYRNLGMFARMEPIFQSIEQLSLEEATPPPPIPVRKLARTGPTPKIPMLRTPRPRKQRAKG